MKKITFLLITFLCLSAISYAQTWTKTYGGASVESGASIIGDNMGSVRYIAGYTKSFGAGGRDAYILKTDEFGDTISYWTTTFGFTDNEVANSIDDYAMPSKLANAFITVGKQYNVNSYDMYVVEFDGTGNEIYSPISFDYAGGDDELLEVKCPMGSIMSTGYVTNASGDKDAILMFLEDNYEDIDSTETHIFGGSGDDVGKCLDGSPWGEILIGGYTESFGAVGKDMYATLYAPSGGQPVKGMTYFETSFGGDGDEEANAVYYDGDGMIMLFGYTTSFGNGGKDIYVVKLDNSGDTLWTKTYGGSGDEEALAYYEDNGYFIITGYTSSYGAGDDDIFILTIDQNTGDSLSFEVYGEPGIDETATGIVRNTCGYYLTGTKDDDILAMEVPLYYNIDANIVDVQCYGEATGEVELMYTGVNSVRDFEWSDGDTLQTPFKYNLVAGDYGITIYDNHDCMYIDSVSVNSPDTLIATITGLVHGCFSQCDKEILLDITGGEAPYGTYFDYFGGGGDFPIDMKEKELPPQDVLFDLCPDRYMVYVLDAWGCMATTDSVTLIDPTSEVSEFVTADNNICYGDCEGIAAVTAVGGAESFLYEWDDPMLSTTDSVFGLCAGEYHVTVSDTFGCSLIDTVEITEPVPYFSEITDVVNNLCFGDSLGSATVTPTGGALPITYSWSNGDADSTAVNLPAGWAFVTITDNVGCEIFDSIEITSPTEIVTSFLIESVPVMLETIVSG